MKVQILFPSSRPKSEERLNSALAAAQETFPSLELLVPRQVRPRTIDPEDYLADSDETRWSELIQLFARPEHWVAWFGRGGYGLTRILRHLKANLVHPEGPPRRMMGYSDLTALFAFTKTEGLPIECIHGPMLCAFCEQPNPATLFQALCGVPTPIPVSKPSSDLRFTGPIWGGNLAVLASLCGTPWLPAVKSGAIFLEDVGEPPYRLDRFLTQLFDSGFFRHTNKVFLGTFTEFEPAESALRTVLKRCQELELEVLGHLPIGHSEPHYPLFLDRVYTYDENLSSLTPRANSPSERTETAYV